MMKPLKEDWDPALDDMTFEDELETYDVPSAAKEFDAPELFEDDDEMSYDASDIGWMNPDQRAAYESEQSYRGYGDDEDDEESDADLYPEIYDDRQNGVGIGPFDDDDDFDEMGGDYPTDEDEEEYFATGGHDGDFEWDDEDDEAEFEYYDDDEEDWSEMDAAAAEEGLTPLGERQLHEFGIFKAKAGGRDLTAPFSPVDDASVSKALGLLAKATGEGEDSAKIVGKLTEKQDKLLEKIINQNQLKEDIIPKKASVKRANTFQVFVDGSTRGPEFAGNIKDPDNKDKIQKALRYIGGRPGANIKCTYAANFDNEQKYNESINFNEIYNDSLREGGPRKNIDYEGIAHQFCLIKDPVARQEACDKLFALIAEKNAKEAAKEAKKAAKVANQAANQVATAPLTESKECDNCGHSPCRCKEYEEYYKAGKKEKKAKKPTGKDCEDCGHDPCRCDDYKANK